MTSLTAMQRRSQYAVHLRVGLAEIIFISVLASCAPTPMPVAPPAATRGTPDVITSASEQPAATEASPAGDIPDSQAFVTYRDPAGRFQIEAPEGWARSDDLTGVRFVDKLDGEAVDVSARSGAVDTAAVRAPAEISALLKTDRAVRDVATKDVALPGGSAVHIAYTSNSEPNSLSGKQVRQESQKYLFFKDGQMAVLSLWAPLGADNVDQWQRIARSFRWLP